MPKGIIICNSSNLYQIQVKQEVYNCLARGKFKKDKITPLVGDYVEINITDEVKKQGVIEQIFPRDNVIKRPKMANLTQLILVVSMKMPEPDLLLLDKQLAFCELMGLNAIICLNKIDLEEEKKVKEIAENYRKIGYKVIETNAKEKLQVEQIKPLLKNQITAFAGNSGVGKSTLINAIFEKSLTIEGDISDKNKRGKNTTTSATLYQYGESSYLADTPGFSTFEINEIEKKDLDKCFIEFIPFLENCEFLGCSHIKEQKCKVKQAMEEGKISKERYENYVKIYQELKEAEEKRW